MAANKEDILGMLNRAPEGTRWMIVVCDTYDHEDYPVYCENADEYHKKYAEHDGKNMQRIMEVYDLKMPIDAQINAMRVFNGPK